MCPAEEGAPGLDRLGSEWSWPGSRWWRVDLHAHSSASRDFSRPNGGERDSTAWVEAAAGAGLDAIAITDHDTGAGISAIQDAAGTVADAPILLPGVEIRAGGGVHLLAVMDPACGPEHIADLLSRAGVPVDTRGQDSARSRLTVEQILDEFGKDALILGAHVNGPKGILQALGGQERLGVLGNPNLAAVEVDPAADLDGTWLDGSKSEVGRRVSQVWASDAHSLEEVGRRFTWVKMTRPDIEGLRLALLDGSGSLKCATRENPGDPNAECAELLIERITVADARYIGRSGPVTVRFNPWLNAIIGGRGTGKSTLIDFCRKTLRREADLDASGERGEEGSLRQLFERRVRVPPPDGEGLLTENTRIKVIYRKHGERFALRWSRDGSDSAICRLDGDERTPEEGSVSKRFPVRIYSQKQLFALAQDPNALLAVVDASPSVQAAEKKREIRDLENRYLSLCARAREAFAKASSLGDRRAELADIQRKLDFLQEGGQAKRLSDYRRSRQLDDTWEAVVATAWRGIQSVAQAAEQLGVPDLDDGRGNLEGDSSLAGLAKAHEALGREIARLRTAVLASVEHSQREIEEIQTGEDLREWRQALAASEEAFRAATAELEDRGIRDPGEYTGLLAEAARLRREIDSLEEDQERAVGFAREAEDTLDSYRERRLVLSEARGAFTEDASGGTIRVAVSPLSNSGGLSRTMIDILGTERFDADRKALVQRIRPSVGDWSWDGLDALVEELRSFQSGEADSWPTEDHRFHAALKRVPPERTDRLALYAPDDSVDVRFKSRDRRWRPLKHGSPGQQTAALLAFVLGVGSEPIVLDQPEDDLDNTLIYDLLVTQLRETKLRRQVIVVTHNPNIVVHGDAELVLSLEAGGGETQIKCKGGLQEQKVRDEICEIMEGGSEAFETRYRRIMPAEVRGS